MTKPKTDYEKPSFSVAPGDSESYRDGWDRIFGKKEVVTTAPLPDPLAPREHVADDQHYIIPEKLHVVVNARTLQRVLDACAMFAVKPRAEDLAELQANVMNAVRLTA